MAVFVLLFDVLLSAIVYRCQLDDGSTEFRGFPCPNGGEVALDVPSAVSARAAGGLSEAEVRALASLQQRLASDTADAKHQRGARQRRNASRAAARRQRCERATSRVGALRIQKRRGYAAKDANRLDAEQARLESIIAADC